MEVALWSEVDELLESYDVLRDRVRWDVGGVMDERGLTSDDALSKLFSLKLNRALADVEAAGLTIAGDMVFRKSR